MNSASPPVIGMKIQNIALQCSGYLACGVQMHVAHTFGITFEHGDTLMVDAGKIS